MADGDGGRRREGFDSMFARLLNDERVRFVIIGGINTVLGYALFVLAYWIAGDRIGYIGSLYVSYAIATIAAFFLHRRYTFRATTTGRIAADFLRFQSVYIVILLFNTVALAFIVEVLGIHPLVAQAAVVVITTLMSYAGHKWFSFRRRPTASRPTDN